VGDWREWKGATRIKNLDVRAVLIERIEKLLYWEKKAKRQGNVIIKKGDQ